MTKQQQALDMIMEPINKICDDHEREANITDVNVNLLYHEIDTRIDTILHDIKYVAPEMRDHALAAKLQAALSHFYMKGFNRALEIIEGETDG